ncbi:hypothetical protein HZB93_01850 [Candidatus Falkowbacteria bacterium]|nr:hypothetical protein [Candidatus Falkowbacteria bacterium]
MSDEFRMTTGQAHELAMAFGRNGWTNADVKKMSEGDLLARLLPVIRGQADVKKPEIPTEMTVGGRVYEILSFLREEDNGFVRGDVMVSRAKELGANLGKEDCEFLLTHQDEIPPALRGKVVFVFPDLRRPGDREHVAYLHWDDGGWYRHWYWLSDDWDGYDRLLRRK